MNRAKEIAALEFKPNGRPAYKCECAIQRFAREMAEKLTELTRITELTRRDDPTKALCGCAECKGLRIASRLILDKAGIGGGIGGGDER